MTASSFTCIPGLPILHSRDLVNWTLIGHALKKYPSPLFNTPQHGKGVWAPSIRYHNRMFYIYWGDPDAGIYMTRSKNPEGLWEDPILVLAGSGMIDSCPLWDENRKAYLVHAWAASRCGVRSLLTLRSMNPEGTQANSDGKHIFDGHGIHTNIEGPKLYKRNGNYYILAPAGGVEQGWQLALRSRHIEGPYEAKIVLEQGGTPVNGPHQGGWVETSSGQSWFMHFQDKGAYGRVVHLQPVHWENDWPVMGRYNKATQKYEPVLTLEKPDIKGQFPITSPAESDEFIGDRLGLQWQWQANPKLTWYVMLKDTDYLRLFAQRMPSEQTTLRDMGNILTQKFPAPDFTATTKMKLVPEEQGKRAGLIIMGNDYACLSMTLSDNGFTLSMNVCENASEGSTEKTIDKVALPCSTVYLRVKVSSPSGTCRFSYSIDDNIYTDLGRDFIAKPGGWIGAKVGLYCVGEENTPPGGYADFYWFRIEE